MTTETAIVETDLEQERKRKLALLRAIGLDRHPREVQELALAIAKRYELDLLLKHALIIEGRVYVTRDGLLHIAHRSGQFDGLETTEARIVEFAGLGEFWTAEATAWRKDMTHGFKYQGRYPTKGGNARFAPEMAVKVAEVMALRRAFDVAAPTAEERWDRDIPDVELEPPKTLAERAAEKAAEIVEPEPIVEAAKRAFVDEPDPEVQAGLELIK